MLESFYNKVADLRPATLSTLFELGWGDWNVLLVYFVLLLFSNSSKFHEVWWLFYRFIYLEFQNSYWFLLCQRFFRTKCYFLYMYYVRGMNTSLTILAVLESRGLRKNFSSITFSIDSVIVILDTNCTWGICFIRKNTYFQWPSWKMMTSSKNRATLVTILVFFEMSYIIQHIYAKFHYDSGLFRPSGYLMSKNPAWLGLKWYSSTGSFLRILGNF